MTSARERAAVSWSGRYHLSSLRLALEDFEAQSCTLTRWGELLAPRLVEGARLLIAGSGGSATQAQHLAAELVGHFRHDRDPMSAICLSSQTFSIAEVASDFGPEEIYARQVEAHGRPGDVLLLLSSNGCDQDLLTAARRARSIGVEVWSLTGAGPNALTELSDESFAVRSDYTPTVQELHLVAAHLICASVDHTLWADRYRLPFEDAIDA